MRAVAGAARAVVEALDRVTTPSSCPTAGSSAPSKRASAALPRPIPNLGGVWLHHAAGTFDAGTPVVAASTSAARSRRSAVAAPE